MRHVTHQKPPKAQPPATSPTPPAPTAAPSNADSAETDHGVSASPVSKPPLTYPEDAESESREGSVTASCDIMPDGHPAHCKIISVKGGSDFAESAMEFLTSPRLRYQPAVINGQPVVEHNHVLHVDFSLGGGNEE